MKETITVVKRNFFAKESNHAFYRNILNDKDDIRVSQGKIIDDLFDNFPDGSMIQLTAEKVGECPGHWRQTGPNGGYQKIQGSAEDHFKKVGSSSG